MANNNKALSAAGQAKKDEFYTQLVDIENELRHYKEHFKGKTVLCNCDDPYESNFFKYFAINFNHLGLKKLICTCYAGSPVVYTQLSLFGEEEVIGEEPSDKKPYKIEITHVDDLNGDGAVDLTDVELLLRSVDGNPTLLKGDGNFRSVECVELLKEADIVVTNPPFSLFREYVVLLEKYHKQYLIIGNVNAITYKEIFPLIKDNRLWLGASIHSGDREFRVPDNYPLNATGCRVDENGIKYIRVKGVRWYTNLDYSQRHEDLILYKSYSPEEYPHYDNYDAIEVSKTADIPCDYDGVMGVPITFMDKYNPEQFEIIGLDRYTVPKEFLVGGRVAINGIPKYARILIRKR
ncbi:MAG: adenine-specific methyltransferase EcoRI family protein [Oscillospiraceae bacterium]|nr:adenine-specific methyltransferase EcoRI family protein [Oscillospiraceae bacterium]